MYIQFKRFQNSILFFIFLIDYHILSLRVDTGHDINPRNTKGKVKIPMQSNSMVYPLTADVLQITTSNIELNSRFICKHFI